MLNVPLFEHHIHEAITVNTKLSNDSNLIILSVCKVGKKTKKVLVPITERTQMSDTDLQIWRAWTN